mmetsp:Transcript_19082/g.48612  ORF Transcript_19082/g.48612 Transcript_19082/m.48612 type:complete len:254 (-) Transcript_19082:937-1698(-)
MGGFFGGDPTVGRRAGRRRNRRDAAGARGHVALVLARGPHLLRAGRGGGPAAQVRAQRSGAALPRLGEHGRQRRHVGRRGGRADGARAVRRLPAEQAPNREGRHSRARVRSVPPTPLWRGGARHLPLSLARRLHVRATRRPGVRRGALALPPQPLPLCQHRLGGQAPPHTAGDAAADGDADEWHGLLRCLVVRTSLRVRSGCGGRADFHLRHTRTFKGRRGCAGGGRCAAATERGTTGEHQAHLFAAVQPAHS